MLLSSIIDHGSDIEFGLVNDIKTNLSEYDIANFKVLSESTLSGSISSTASILENIVNVKVDVLNRYISSAMDNVSVILNHNDELTNFFTDIQNGLDLAKTKFTIGIQNTKEIDKIRGQYLLQEVSDISNALNFFLTKKYDKDELEHKYLTRDCTEKLKRQMVKTSLSVNEDYGNLPNYVRPNIVIVNGDFVSGPLLDFLKNIGEVFEEQAQTILRVKKCLSDSSKELIVNIKAVDKIKTTQLVDDPKTARDLDNLLYSFVRQYMEVSSYLAYMIIRKLNSISYNLASYYDLYNNIKNIYPQGGRILHENTIDGNFEDIENDQMFNSAVNDNLGILFYNIEGIIDMKRQDIASKSSQLYGATNIYNEIDIFAANYDYDKTIYEQCKMIFRSISDSIDTFSANIKDGQIMDDALESSGLSESLSNKFNSTLRTLDNLANYSNENTLENMMPMYHELIEFKNNAVSIGEYVGETWTKITDAEVEFSDVTDKQLVSDTTLKEVQGFLFDLDVDFHDLVVLFVRELNARLEELASRLGSINCGVTVDLFIPESATDYNIESISDTLLALEASNEEIMTDLIRDFKVKNYRKQTGLNLVFEDGDNNQNNNQNTNANKPNNDNKQKPTAQVNNNANTNANNDNKNDNQQNKNNIGDKAKNLASNIYKFIISVLEKFRTKVGELLGSNQKWLDDNKDKLLNVKPDGLTVSILPYDIIDPKTIQRNVSTAVNKVNMLDKGKLSNMSADDIRGQIFDFIPNNLKIGDNNNPSFAAVVKQYYAIGKQPSKLKEYSGSNAKSLVNNMIKYCGEYKAITDNVSTALEGLAKAVDKKASENGTPQNTQNNDQNNNNSNSNNSSTAMSSLQKFTREYSTAAITSLEARYIAYLSMLRNISGQIK